MNAIMERIAEIGIIPVVKIENARDAVGTGKALMAGDLPLVEITFRTAAAEEAIGNLTRELPELLVGAGTVITVEQAKKALGAGAKFIVAPGFNPRVVDFVIGQGVPMIPGVSSPTDIEMALEKGLEILKLFPAGALGGLEFMKAVAAPYTGVKFIPTGGVDTSNLKEYLSFGRVFAVGGTWIAKEAAIAEGKFEEISRLAREAVSLSLGFELAHVGINELDPPAAMFAAAEFATLFSFTPREGTSSVFAGSGVEIMKNPYLGTHGHIAISCLNIHRAIAYLKRKGAGIRPDTAKEKDGRLIAVYIDRDIAGFAVHLLSK
jgi:2-dehydro-3-deoxyphosphogluconate aldolase / (4S)-4-hydroxy-2-oxoglutarate aldolase